MRTLERERPAGEAKRAVALLPEAVERVLRASGDRPIPTALILSIAALVLSLIALGRESLWLDEAYSVAVAKLPTGAFLELLVEREAIMVPYYVLLRGWIALGDGEAILRILSVIPAVATVPFGIAVARRLIGRQASAVAGALLVVNAFFVEFAQEVRGYSLVLLLVTVATFLFVRAIDAGSPPLTWVGYVVVSGLAVYTHFFAAFVVLAHLVSILALAPKERPSRRTMGAVFAGIGVLVLPLALFVLTTSHQRAWIPGPSIGGIARSIANLAGAHAIVGAALVPMYAVLAWPLVGRMISAWRAHRRSRDTWAMLLIVAWVAAPVVGGLMISVAKPVFVDRYLIVALPGLALAGTAGFVLASSRRFAAALLGAVLIVSISQVALLYVARDHEDWRAATRTVLAAARDGDAVAFYRPFGKVPWAYYVERSGSGEILPAPVHPIFDWRTEDLTNPRTLDPATLAASLSGHDRVWLVLSHAPATEAVVIREVLDRRFDVASSELLAGVEVLLYERETG